MSINEWLEETPYTLSFCFVGLTGLHLGSQRSEDPAPVLLAAYTSFFLPFVIKGIDNYFTPVRTDRHNGTLDGLITDNLPAALYGGVKGIATFVILYNLGEVINAAMKYGP